jgi:hypothetical protein
VSGHASAASVPQQSPPERVEGVRAGADELIVPTRDNCRPGSNAWEWLEFHEKYPLVGPLFLGEAMCQRQEAMEEKRRNGFPASSVRISAKGIWEELRKRLAKGNAADGQPYKLNNNYTAFYARWAIQQQPLLKGCLKFRRAGNEKAGPTTEI